MPVSCIKSIGLAAVIAVTAGSGAFAAEATPETVANHYADVAAAMYGDAHAAGADLAGAIDALIAAPSKASLAAARKAWINSRPWYQQTEGYRFGNAIVDDWEGKVNSWPLDEGLVDYVDAGSYGDTSDENPLYTANVIANTSVRIGNDVVDASTIDAALLQRMQSAGDVEANVATGYHAVEFLLWGQDLHGTGPGAGERPHTDFDLKNCTGGNCDRRVAYLKAATQLLVSDLAEMADAWKPGGKARQELLDKGAEGSLSTILTGLGSLSYGELAGERMKLGLILHDPEEEHDCFSDNTHNSHYFDQVGMMAIHSGTYHRRDGSTLEGPGIAALAGAKAPEEAKAVEQAMATAESKLKLIKDTADSGKMAYDQMLAKDNAEGNKLIEDAIAALVAQARGIEAEVAKLGLTIKMEGSDSLDNPSAVSSE
jgi:putative iron-regulated protein